MKYYCTPDGNNLNIGGTRRRTGESFTLNQTVADPELGRGTIETEEKYNERQNATQLQAPAPEPELAPRRKP